MENRQKLIKADFTGVRKNTTKGGGTVVKIIYKTKNICSIVPILVNYLDNSISIIFQKFQALDKYY